MSGIREHRVRLGETLQSIAEDYYGKGCARQYALVIYQHNRDELSNPNVIYPGQLLVIPHVTHGIF